MSLDSFVAWLGETPVSKAIGDNAWVTPTVQTVHILAIALIMSAILMTNLRMLGAIGADEPLSGFSKRYGPWIGGALIVLFISGSTLIIGEPRRSLENPIFVLKMGMLIVALAATVVLLTPLRRNAEFWASAGRARVAKGLAGGSMLVWVGIIFAGRWIAYAAT